MKKNLVMALGAALLMGGLSARAQAQASTPVTAAPSASTSSAPRATAATPLKIGYTSMDYLLQQAPEAKDIQNQLTITRTQLENESKRLQKEFEDKYKAYEAGQAQMSEVIKADREKELQGLQTRLQEFQRNAEGTLQKKYQDLVSPVLQKIQKNVDAVAKENGYSHIFNLDAGAGTAVILLYAPEDGNISDLVAKKMGVTPKPAGAATGAATTPAPKK
ncbi:outer membrane protein [Fibrella aestuarina BUZ 2]|uniref:Outer membrane protein n=1 Tax=Fibrella aestuarina BUZ 2 TaxID=1166018 RepID=I0KEP5_9BACT|nr:OmpH family outer membrane protein [Fibrella aestuarina]CCH02598.1 outer membrane protein [Fibrella aestuarina BUZ 2]